jgi:hypothetical protein
MITNAQKQKSSTVKAFYMAAKNLIGVKLLTDDIKIINMILSITFIK